jgi:hypothetical protein
LRTHNLRVNASAGLSTLSPEGDEERLSGLAGDGAGRLDVVEPGHFSSRARWEPERASAGNGAETQGQSSAKLRWSHQVDFLVHLRLKKA